MSQILSLTKNVWSVRGAWHYIGRPELHNIEAPKVWPLDENYTMKDYYFCKGKVLDLRGKSKVKIHVERTVRQSVTVTMNEKDPDWKIKEKIQEQTCLHPDTFTFNPISKQAGSEVSTATEVPKKKAQNTRHECDNQHAGWAEGPCELPALGVVRGCQAEVLSGERLYLGGCVRPMDDNYMLKDYDFRKGEVLDLRGKSRVKMHIERTVRESVIVTLNETDPYKKIKEKIQEQTCLQPDTFILDPTACPTGKVKATVESEVRFSLNVDLDFTMGKVKELIQLSEGFPPDRYALYFQGTKLQDPSQTLKGLGVGEDETLQLSFLPKKMEITVKMRRAGRGHTVADSADCVFRVEVNPKDTVVSLKEALQKQTQIPVSAQKLLFCDDFLDNNNTLFDCGLQHGATVLFFTKPWGEKMRLVVKTLTGKSFHVSTRPSETIYELKEKIQVKDGLPPDEQRIIFAGKQLEDCKLLWWYQLKDGDLLHLVERRRGS